MATVSNGTDSASPIAMLTAEMGVLKQRVTAMESRFDAVESKLAELGERVARLETAIDFLRSDIRSLAENHAARRSDLKSLSDRQIADFRLMFGSLITVAIGLSGMIAKGFGWL
jgi:chromosome segregation ATPase